MKTKSIFAALIAVLIIQLTCYNFANAGPGPRSVWDVDSAPVIFQASNGRGYSIVSPDHPETFTNGSTNRYVLSWDSRNNILLALITFTNSPYIDRNNPLKTDQYNFRFPGTSVGPNGIIYGNFNGAKIPVAALKQGVLADNATPTAGTMIYVTKPQGKITVTLTADPSAPPVVDGKSHWNISGLVLK